MTAIGGRKDFEDSSKGSSLTKHHKQLSVQWGGKTITFDRHSKQFDETSSLIKKLSEEDTIKLTDATLKAGVSDLNLNDASAANRKEAVHRLKTIKEALGEIKRIREKIESKSKTSHKDIEFIETRIQQVENVFQGKKQSS